jgi:hypothetical protein
MAATLAGGYYLNTTTTTCTQYNDPALTDQGRKTSDGTMAFCTASNCINCRDAYYQCIACNTAAGYYRDPATNTCLLYTTLPDGKGRKTSDGTVQSCTDAHCLNCRNNYATCDACDTATGYYLLASPNSCLLYTSLANGKGRKTADGTVQLCTDSNCLNCRNNYAVCDGCNIGTGYYLNTTTTTCILYSNPALTDPRKEDFGWNNGLLHRFPLCQLQERLLPVYQLRHHQLLLPRYHDLRLHSQH